MALINNITVLSPQTVTNDNALSFKTKANNNWSLAQTEGQKIEARVENSFSSLCGEGLLTLPTVSYSGSSLSVSYTAFTYLIGVYLSKAAGTATLLANQTAGHLYLCNDGTWSTSVPTTKSYFLFADYTTDGTGILTFTLKTMLLPKLATVTGTVTGIVVPDNPGYVEQYIDHSATVVFAIPGFITLNVTPVSDFYVELLYNGNVISTSDTLTSPPQNCTEKGFHYKISRRAGYYYAGSPTCTLTYTRTGMAVTV